MEYQRTIVVTGGAGFIGSHLIRLLLKKYADYRIVNYDLLTYAGNLGNLKDVENNSNYTFVKGDICNAEEVEKLFTVYRPDSFIHLAAESHVDRSIEDPLAFIETNIKGTAVLLNACRKHWGNDESKLFYHVSTDEVFGSLGDDGMFTETTAYDPRSPYSASKASSDHLVRAYHHTYGLPIKISNCSNNYGSHQFPEKLIPLMIQNIRHNKPLPVYGKGINVRDWLWVNDHADAIDTIFHKGKVGETYAIGGKNEIRNIDLVRKLCQLVDQKLGRETGSSEELITFVTDRAGHDMRYAIDPQKLEDELGWTPSVTFEEGLSHTIDWYLANSDWLDEVTSGNYQEYYELMYGSR
ncbi:MAG: dTDP-glucose 4,6-dehydratase [Flavobacteriales bacterium]|nr:dTDP-glucose 4,6-dehydratase [Flavobacteriales bacterium]MDG1779377.1 dTDP-glucose 4,6-dehydratase [Flavobacteriales bacterium]MDG2245156.1 dTDP-glucose 4,6-dehydratase [Flavobacteriales bacterium]